MSENVYLEEFTIGRGEREGLLNQKGIVIWFTGLSGSGKSTIANALEKELHKRGKLTYVLDGDNLRLSLNSDLKFTEEDRKENLRRVGEVSKILVNLGVITLCTFVSPIRQDREETRKLLGNDYKEVYVNCPFSECEKRDPKNLYKRARNGEIKNFTGLDSPYEAPVSPEITIDTTNTTVEEAVERIINTLNL
ncbi:adenylyl-sulfate kinase [Clostridium cylindrosporum]|uniref:Adenylyl-sulfate kinase n=1 Tax=Clostridium cylindrosporum DSM 605 TaxID=1121307 RepID=A0A0J8DB72_CLOCY|nr:adenylyl-sulfate kinase [Clostridium cylindrosporum]KMT23325.1 adenylyl-sulfate kinase CysC [Clostridium cylindrosporum DSM 605]